MPKLFRIMILLFSIFSFNAIFSQDQKPVKTNVESKPKEVEKTKEELENEQKKKDKVDFEKAKQRELLIKQIEIQRKKDLEEYELQQKVKIKNN